MFNQSTSATDTVTLSFTVENTYLDDGAETTTTFVDVVVPAPDPSVDPTDLNEWAEDHLYEFTGTDRPCGAAVYDLTITASTDRRLLDARFDWGY